MRPAIALASTTCQQKLPSFTRQLHHFLEVDYALPRCTQPTRPWSVTKFSRRCKAQTLRSK